MQVLENAVRKLKMPSRDEEPRERVEPRFTPVANPTPISAASAAPPPPRRPLFSDLPTPDDAPVDEVDLSHGGGGGGGGTGGSSSGDDDPNSFGPILTWFGAAAAVALVVGVSVWTYRLGQRDAMEVPIVAALEGPARVAPGDSGGRVVANQGHSVNRVLEGGGVAGVASSVTTAPRDNDLTGEDVPRRELSVLLASRTPMARPATDRNAADGETELALRIQETQDASDAAAESLNTTDAKTVVVPNSDGDVVITVRDAEDADAKPVEPGALASDTAAEKIGEDADVADATDGTGRQDLVELAALGPFPPDGHGSAYAPAVMLLPRARPADLNAAMSDAVNAALDAVLNGATTPAAPETDGVETAAVGEVVAEPVDKLDTIPLPSGTSMIQLGAYASEAVARQQWDRLSNQHDDLLGSKDHYVQRTDSSGKIFYRLRVAGYDTKEDTRAACAAISARGLPCITVTLR